MKCFRCDVIFLPWQVSNRRLEPTKLGVCLVHGYMMIDPELVLPSIRASIEALVDVIAKGRYRRVSFPSIVYFTRRIACITG